MTPATKPRSASDPGRLLAIDPSRSTIEHAHARDLAALLEPRDLVVINDAATLPASFALPERGMEVRLVAQGPGVSEFRTVLFGRGDYTTPTEERPAPPLVRAGETLRLGAGLDAEVTHVDAEAPRFVTLRFALPPAALLRALYRHGRPIQYAYVPEPLAIWDVQNRFGARPWAFELPSAGQVFDGELLLALRKRGVAIATLTHAAGISSTGSTELDRRFPLPERFEIPDATTAAITSTRELGGRVLAVGTTVVRALEASALLDGVVHAGPGVASILLGPGYRPRVAHGVLSGMHEAGTSHFALLEAFAPRGLLDRALAEAHARSYRQHEFGDFTLILPARAD
jgi:S-adenosylmethionine:tRNA ribosyltransferase-isomerase